MAVVRRSSFARPTWPASRGLHAPRRAVAVLSPPPSSPPKCRCRQLLAGGPSPSASRPSRPLRAAAAAALHVARRRPPPLRGSAAGGCGPGSVSPRGLRARLLPRGRGAGAARPLAAAQAPHAASGKISSANLFLLMVPWPSGSKCLKSSCVYLSLRPTFIAMNISWNFSSLMEPFLSPSKR